MLDPRAIAPDVPRPIRRSEYERMVDLGMFEDERVELLDGVIVQMSPTGPDHDSVIERLTEILVRAVVPRATVRVQSAFAAGEGSQPQPDLALVPRRDHSKQHPDEAFLIIEVSSSSLPKDLGAKARIYAEAGVPEYWVVDVAARAVVVHRSLTATGYAAIATHPAGQRVAPMAFPDVVIEIAALFA